MLRLLGKFIKNGSTLEWKVLESHTFAKQLKELMLNVSNILKV